MIRPLSNRDLGVFFEDRHHRLAEQLLGMAADISDTGAPSRPDRAARLAADLGARWGLYHHLLPEQGPPDVRALCLIRELLGWASPLADALFAVHGLGSYPLLLAGSPAQRALLPRFRRGELVGAFALTEPEAGSDVAGLRTEARRDGDGFVLTGHKTLISSVGIATHYVLFANADPAAGRRGISAFLVPADTPGLRATPIPMAIDHPIGELELQDCRVPADALIGDLGGGFRLAMQTLDTFRVSVGAAAVGMARRALAAATDHVKTRVQFGKPLAEQPVIQAQLAEMLTELDAARLLVLRAAWAKDTTTDRLTAEAAMAKLYATEAAQRIIDRAVQLHGGRGVVAGEVVEELYRAIRPLRIYEGATEVLAMVIGRSIVGDSIMAVAFPEDFNLADYWLFDRLGEGLGDAPAIRYGDRCWSYAEVAERSRALARYFVDAGLAREQRVYVVLPDTPPFAWSIFATLAAGGVLAMGNPDAPVADLEYVVDYTRCAVLVTLPRVAEMLAPVLDKSRELRAVLLVPDTATGGDAEQPAPVPANLHGKRYAALSLHEAIARGRDSGAPLPPTRRDDTCIWLFTSGSTGHSKAAVHTHRDFAFNTEVYAKGTVGYRRGDITVSVPRLYFGYATGTNLWFPFAVGATVGLFSERPTPETLAAAIARYRPTVVTNVPTMLGKLLDHDAELRGRGQPGLDMSCVRFHLSAGEALPPALLERFLARFGCDVYDGIGSAEMFHIYCSNRPGDIKPGSLGRAVDGYELRVLAQDADGPGAPPVAPGEIGILWVKGDSVALGYHQDRDKSWKTFHGHWCRTGDLFAVDDAGYLWFAGRADELFKAGGLWVAPLEVEECLVAHEAVSLAAVIAARDADGLDKPKAFVVVSEAHRARLAADPAGLRAELKDHVKGRLSKHKYPRWVVFIDDLPRNDRGKVDRKLLRERELAGESPGE